MKYLLLICSEADGWHEPDPGGLTIEEWVEEVDGKGIRIIGDRVRPAADATTVRVRGGETILVDGPYAETKEQMAGFDIIECDDLDQAIEVASRHPVARSGQVEVRPFWVE